MPSWRRIACALAAALGALCNLATAAPAAQADAASVVPMVVREREHNGQVVYVGMADEGRQLVTVDYAGGVYQWDAKSLRQVSTRLRVPFAVRAATLRSPHTLVVAGSMPRDFLALVDLGGSGELKVLGHAGGEPIAFSSLAKSGAVRAVVVVTGEAIVRVIELDAYGTITEKSRVAKAAVTAAAISEDGGLMALATNKSDLALMDAATGRVVWERHVDAVLTSLSISARDGVLGGYDNVLGFRLKRIDHFDIATGRTTRTISTQTCSVFQVQSLSAGRGFAICGPSTMDSVANLSKRIRTSFLTWSLADDREAMTTFSPFAGGSGSLGYLPFAAGIAFDAESQRVFVGGGDGSMFVANLPTRQRPAGIERLAPVPQVAQRFGVSEMPHEVVVVDNVIGRNGAPEDSRARISTVRMRAAVAEAGATEKLSDDEVQASIDPGNILTDIALPQNSVRFWDIDRGLSEGVAYSPLGYVLDAIPGSVASPALALEALPASAAGVELESTMLAVSQIVRGDGLQLVRRRLVSIDSTTGLLKEGARHPRSSEGKYAVCPSANMPGYARLSYDGGLLAMACMVLPTGDPANPQNFLHPDFDLLTLWLGSNSSATPARVRFGGTPSHIEPSPNGSFVAVLSSWQSMGKGASLVDTESHNALTIIDARHGRVVAEMHEIAEPPSGAALRFSQDSRHLYLALGTKVYRNDIGTDVLTPVDILPGNAGPVTAISSIATDREGLRLAVSRRNGATEIYRLPDLQRIGAIRHPGDVMDEIAFDPAAGTKLLASSSSGGITVFDYAQGTKLVDLMTYSRDRWIAVAPDGVFSAPIGGELGVTVTDGRQAVAIDQLYDLYFRPDMLKRRIAGQNPDPPAPEAVRHALAMPPPTVDLTLKESPVGRVIASIEIRDQGGGIGGLRAFHDGKLAEDLDTEALRKLAQPGPPSANSTLRIDVPLSAGDGPNDYVVTAMNADRSAQGRFAKASVELSIDKAVPRRAYVLMIGTNTFERASLPKLTIAEASSTRLGGAFATALAGVVGAQNVKVIDLVGEGSRSDVVERALDTLEQTARSDDIVAVVITTHGRVLPSGEMQAVLRDTADDDIHGLTSARLIATMNRIQALTQILVLDICRGGLLPKQVSAIYQDRFAVLAGRAGINVFASTSSDEPAEGAYGGTTPFAHYMIDGLAPGTRPVAGGRSLHAIADNARKQVIELPAIKQEPMIYQFGKDLSLP